MKYLLVVAHPDDEVLGAGGSIHKWTRQGHEVDVCIMSTHAQARAFRPQDNELNDDINSATHFIGISRKFEFKFPNIEMNTVSHLKLVQAIEEAIIQSQPDVVITHYPSDPNNDHLQTSIACQAAIRLPQRRPEMKRINELWYMEVPSCTEWDVNSVANPFRPNCYVEIGEKGVEAKIKALEMYRGVMRPYPHPRSKEYIRGLAAVRGSEWGLNFAEAYQVVLRNYV